MSASEERYVELQVSTAFSFLRGASHPDELVRAAAKLGYKRIAIADRNGLYGVVQAYRSGLEHGVEVIPGAELTLSDKKGSSLLLLPENRESYGHLCRLITLGRQRGPKGEFHLGLEDVAACSDGLQAIHMGVLDEARLRAEKDIFGERLSIGISRRLLPSDRKNLEQAQSLSARLCLGRVVTGGVLMHSAERKPLQDILTCIRMGLRLEQAGRYLLPNHTARLRSIEGVERLYSDQKEAMEESIRIADACAFRLDEIKQEFVLEVLPEGETGDGYLRKLVMRGMNERYPQGASEKVIRQVEHELSQIQYLDYSGYFLTVWDIVRWSRSQNILCQGRGSAANSIVCYLLGITSIDPIRMNLLFERFISVERNEPPDIDVDIEHERREEVIQYVYRKYGRHHASMVANVIRYRERLAYREVAKVLGFDEEQVTKLLRNRSYWGSNPVEAGELRAAGLDPKEHMVQELIRWGGALIGFPRHLGIHPGGFVITRQPLVEFVPVENAAKANRTVIEWDKRDVETMGMVKIDLLGLGMLSVIRKCFEELQKQGVSIDLASIPPEDELVYDMICDADTIGTFQVESRAQMQMLPRLKPRTFYDLVISVAIVRPGPIQGDMVHPYLRRRDGREAHEYPHPALESILGKTYGIPLFQEQVMKMAIAISGFTAGEADQLRRAIGWQSDIEINALRTRLIDGMLANGLDATYAERVFRMIQGFGGYGFPESHAASFALIVYASCYLKRYYPAAYLIGLLNSQPMGFYRPSTLVADAQRHGVEVRPVSLQESDWEARAEQGDREWVQAWWRSCRRPFCEHTPWSDEQKGRIRYGQAIQPAVRLGFDSIRGLSQESGRRIEAARREQKFSSISDVAKRAGVTKEQLLRLASADALSCFGVTRREAVWQVLSMSCGGNLFAHAPFPSNVEASEVDIPSMNSLEKLQADYASMGMSLATHPMALMRSRLEAEGVYASNAIHTAREGAIVAVAGVVIVRQRPSTAQGVVFITLEDEHGHINLIVFRQIYERYKPVSQAANMLKVCGRLKRAGKVIHIIVEHMSPLSLDASVELRSRDFR